MSYTTEMSDLMENRFVVKFFEYEYSDLYEGTGTWERKFSSREEAENFIEDYEGPNQGYVSATIIDRWKS